MVNGIIKSAPKKFNINSLIPYSALPLYGEGVEHERQVIRIWAYYW